MLHLDTRSIPRCSAEDSVNPTQHLQMIRALHGPRTENIVAAHTRSTNSLTGMICDLFPWMRIVVSRRQHSPSCATVNLVCELQHLCEVSRVPSRGKTNYPTCLISTSSSVNVHAVGSERKASRNYLLFAPLMALCCLRCLCQNLRFVTIFSLVPWRGCPMSWVSPAQGVYLLKACDCLGNCCGLGSCAEPLCSTVRRLAPRSASEVVDRTTARADGEE